MPASGLQSQINGHWIDLIRVCFSFWMEGRSSRRAAAYDLTSKNRDNHERIMTSTARRSQRASGYIITESLEGSAYLEKDPNLVMNSKELRMPWLGPNGAMGLRWGRIDSQTGIGNPWKPDPVSVCESWKPDPLSVCESCQLGNVTRHRGDKRILNLFPLQAGGIDSKIGVSGIACQRSEVQGIGCHAWIFYFISGVTWDLVQDLGVQLSLLLLHTQRKGKLKNQLKIEA